MADLEKAVRYMEELCNDDSHGYSQINRQGPDYDCSSSVITSLRAGGFDTGNASYTGNMRSNLSARGWSVLSAGVPKKRGDLLLWDGKHVAMYVGNGKLAEFSGDENGGIQGKIPGDQTGREAWIHGYYNYPWSCVLRYTGGASTGTVESSQMPHGVIFTYQARTEDGNIWDEVQNLNDYAGMRGRKITDIAIKVNKGAVWYQVHVLGGGWLPAVTGYDWNDYTNGYAGEHKVIDAIRVYYTTPESVINTYGYVQAQYRVSPVNGNYYEWQYDDETGTARGIPQDGYAGEFGVPIDRFQLW